MKTRYPAISIMALCATLLTVTQSPAQTFPAKTVRIVVPYAAGGPVDTVTRIAAQNLTAEMGPTGHRRQPRGQRRRVGRAGGGEITARRLHAAHHEQRADHVLSAHAQDPALRFRAGPRADIAAVAIQHRAGRASFAAGAACPSSSRWRRSNPGALYVRDLRRRRRAAPRDGAARIMAGIELIHVPYKGAAPRSVDVLSGQVPMQFNSVLGTMPEHQGRAAASARGFYRTALCRIAGRTADRKILSGASRSPAGWACTRPRAPRNRSWTNSTGT